MLKASDLILSAENDTISTKIIDNTCNKATDYLKNKCSCLFKSKNHLKWVISTWCRKITVSNIVKVRSKSDVELLGNVQVKHHKNKQSRKTGEGNLQRKKKSFLLNKKHVNSCETKPNVYDLECVDDKINSSSAMVLKLNGKGCFSSTQCSYCKILPTTYRCCFSISSGKHKLEGERTCGIAFYSNAWLHGVIIYIIIVAKNHR